MEFERVLSDVYDSGENLVSESIERIVASERYCAMCEIMIQHIQNNRKEAELFADYFRKKNELIFNQAIEILDMAIDNADVQLAQCAKELITAMRETYPEFYSTFQRKLFGKRGSV